MFIKLKDGRKLNILYLSDCFQGKHDKSVVVFYLVNSTKLIENYESEADAEARVEEIDEILSSGFGGGSGTAVKDGGIVQKSTKSSFPATGDVKNLYIETSTKTAFYWSSTDKKYIELGGVGGSAILERDITSNITCGAAPAGTKFPKGMTFTEFAETLLLTEVEPNITTSFSNTGVREVGTSVSNTTMTLNITNLSLVTSTIKTISFYDGSTLLDTVNFTAGKSTYTYVYNQVITSNTPATFTMKAVIEYETSSGTKKSKNGTGTFQFVNPSYYGFSSILSVTDTDITSLNKRISTNNKFTWTGITMNNMRTVYANPFGYPTTIKDANNFEYNGSYTKSTVSINILGNPVTYYVLVLTDPTSVTGFKQDFA